MGKLQVIVVFDRVEVVGEGKRGRAHGAWSQLRQVKHGTAMHQSNHISILPQSVELHTLRLFLDREEFYRIASEPHVPLQKPADIVVASPTTDSPSLRKFVAITRKCLERAKDRL